MPFFIDFKVVFPFASDGEPSKSRIGNDSVLPPLYIKLYTRVGGCWLFLSCYIGEGVKLYFELWLVLWLVLWNPLF